MTKFEVGKNLYGYSDTRPVLVSPGRASSHDIIGWEFDGTWFLYDDGDFIVNSLKVVEHCLNNNITFVSYNKLTDWL